jgi:hypothetical protein
MLVSEISFGMVLLVQKRTLDYLADLSAGAEDRQRGNQHAGAIHERKACSKTESNLSKEDMLPLYQQTAQLLGLPKGDWEPFTDCMEGRSIT